MFIAIIRKSGDVYLVRILEVVRRKELSSETKALCIFTFWDTFAE